jgi:hypothetical protein
VEEISKRKWGTWEMSKPSFNDTTFFGYHIQHGKAFVKQYILETMIKK